MSIKVFQDTDTNTVKYNDNMSIPNQNFKIVQSNDNLKSSQYNNNKSMRPKLNEDNHNPKENMLLNDINLLGNPKKTKGMSSSEEETDNTYTESDVMTEEDNTSMTGDADRLLGNNHDSDGDGNNFDPFNNDESSGSSGSEEDETSNEETNSTNKSGEETNMTASSRRRPPQRQKTLDEINQEKQEMLYRLERFEQNGFKASRKFNMTSNYDDIKFEYERIKKQRDVDKSIKFQRKILMAVCSGVEFLNGKFDPLNVKLDGWSESIYENLQEYDEVFEDLHEKYKEKVKVAPELKLLMMVGGSAFMFHLTNSLFKSKMPGLGDILQQNPELARNVQQAAMNSMKQNEDKNGNSDPLFGMMMNQAQGMMNKRAGGNAGPREMRGPSGVDDILAMVNNQNQKQQQQAQSKQEDTISSVSSQESTKKRIKIKKPSGNGNGKFVLNLQ
jgi:hypothetical protein